MLLKKIIKKFNEKKIKYAICGGYAVTLHGYPRNTVDIDFLTNLTLKNLKNVELAMKELGFLSRLPVNAEDIFHFKDEYIEKKNLIAWNFVGGPNQIEQVDILINMDAREVKTEDFLYEEITLKVISYKDLLKMKKMSGRDKDLIDIKELKNANRKRD